MALIEILDLIVKGFEEFVYMVAYFVLYVSRKAWSYRWIIATSVVMGGFFFYALYIYGIKTN